MSDAQKHNDALNSALLLDDERLKEIQSKDPNPFTDGMRICCPLKGFGHRRTSLCLSCEHFGGIGQKATTGGDFTLPENVAHKYTIICGHPVARGLSWFPED